MPRASGATKDKEETKRKPQVVMRELLTGIMAGVAFEPSEKARLMELVDEACGEAPVYSPLKDPDEE